MAEQDTDILLMFLQSAAFVIFVFATCGLIMRSVSRLYLKKEAARLRTNSGATPAVFPDHDLPLQLIQLPVYNEEPEMVKKLINSAADLEYPRSRLFVQVLDDSDQAAISREIRDHVSALSAGDPGLAVHYHHRTQREGYKAGNLNHGLSTAGKQYGSQFHKNRDNTIVSIFDADFIIPTDYLIKTVHSFTDPEVCAVQAPITYINSAQNLLTRVQTTYLSNLHRGEFYPRSASGHLTTFRGSAGSWRLSTIEKHGGWSPDTQIEDVDLSVAAQLAGDRILYVSEPAVPSRLPASYSGFKLQQRSWMKGIMEVFRKHFRGIISSRHYTLSRKVMALELFTVLSFQPVFMITHHLTAIWSYYFLARFGLGSTMDIGAASLALLLNISHLPFMGKDLTRDRTCGTGTPAAKYSLMGPRAASIFISLGMFPTFTYGILEGLGGGRVHREPTQKSASGPGAPPVLPAAHRKILGQIAAIELALAIFSLLFVTWGAINGRWGMLLLYGPFAAAYPWMLVNSLKELSGGSGSSPMVEQP